MKVSSNTGAARAAVSGFLNIELNVAWQQVSLGESNLLSMTCGADLANNFTTLLTDFVSSVKRQSEGVTDLALAIEVRDKTDAAGMK